MDVRLGYTHDVGELHANWTEVARSTEDRPLHCTVNKVVLRSLGVSVCLSVCLSVLMNSSVKCNKSLQFQHFFLFIRDSCSNDLRTLMLRNK